MNGSAIPAAPRPKVRGGPPRRSRSTRRRFAVLIAVHLAILAHVAHWWWTGRSISPVEPSEAHEALTHGVINAGLVLLALSVLSTLVLGRWFCGWACHVVALQDLCAGVLGRLRIRPRPVRARVLALVPFLAAFDVFLLPWILRRIDGRAFPGLTAAFTTDDLWRTFPGPWMAAATLAVDGFLIVYLLGAKGFCTYGCPYGAIFGVADRSAPGRIRVTDACEGCGHCTATCSSNVDVRAEIARFGMVVDSGCMKCLDCVSVCPKDALYFGFGPVPEKARGKSRRPKRQWDFSWGEEALMAGVFLPALYGFRGLYGAVPFLLALGLAVIAAFAAALAWRLARRPEVAFQDRVLKRGGRPTRAGVVAALACAALLAAAGHSALVQYHARVGEWALVRANAMALTPERGTDAYRERMLQAEHHLSAALALGLVETAALHHKLGSLRLGLDRRAEAEHNLARAIEIDGSYVNARLRLAELLLLEGRHAEATDVLAQVLERDPSNALAGQRLAALIQAAPEMPGPRLLLVDLLIHAGDLEGARNGLAPLVQHIPDHAQVVRRVEALERAEAAEGAR